MRLKSLVLFALALHASDLYAQDPPAAPKPSAQVPPPIELTVSPQSEPQPPFRYRLFPLESQRTPGDAAPIYLRSWCERSPEGLKALEEKPPEWLDLPNDRFPLAEARTFVNEWSRLFAQLEFAAKRRTCDWNYTLPEEREHSFEILLPDAQASRQLARLLALKARVEIAEGKFTEAARTIETGLALARHVAEGPFLINVLVGNSIAGLMLNRLEEWVSKPDAPNLYWSLTALPRPFLDFRKAFEIDVMMTEWLFPELDRLNVVRSEAEWSAMFARFHAKLVTMGKLVGLINPDKKVRVEENLAQFRVSLLPEAKAVGKGDDEILLKYIAGMMNQIRDAWSKGFYLNLPESAEFVAEANRLAQEARSTPLEVLWSLTPTVEACQSAEARLDRRIAALRIIEAIRLQAAADGGKLPESLAKVTIVPIPLDPATNQPFSYRAEGAVMVLESHLFHEGKLTYRIVLRK